MVKNTKGMLLEEREGSQTLEYVVVAAVGLAIFMGFFQAVSGPIASQISNIVSYINDATFSAS